MLDLFPEWVRIFIMSMIPWFESRYTVVVAMLFMNWEWWQVYPIAVLGNMLPVPFILLFFKFVEKFLRRFKFWSKTLDRLFAYTRRRAGIKIKRYEHIGLLLFVAIPIPFTGAWTGSLIAYLFNLKFSRSLITIFIGVLIAALIMVVLTLYFNNIFGFKI